MVRLAWFSPMPPVATGIARCSADLVGALKDDYAIDLFVDRTNLSTPAERDGSQSPAATASAMGDARNSRHSAHDFVWRHRKAPYDLAVYQLGNSSHHDYQWPYLFRYPGLVVLHDAHLHHARAACLLRTFRADDYRSEFRANHADANPDLAELAVAGFDNHLHYAWPMTRLVIERARLVAVHAEALADEMRTQHPRVPIETVRLGHGVALSEAGAASAATEARRRHGIPVNAIVFGCYGGLTPDKRIPQILAAFAATRAYMPHAHLLLAGALAPQCDVRADIERLRLGDCATVTGYLQRDDDLTGAIAACDVALSLRWPTAREISGPWLRCLAAAKPTITIDLAHTSSVPSIDPRTWQPNRLGESACTIGIDIVDEDHSLRLAMRRLAQDEALRMTLGRAARRYWERHHSIAGMADDYRRVIARAIAAPAPDAGSPLPGHLLDNGAGTLQKVMRDIGLPGPLRM